MKIENLHIFKNSTKRRLLAVGLGLFILFPALLHGQTLELSRSADFSTFDESFAFSDTLFARVIFPQVDFTDIDENAWSISSKIGDKRSTTIEGEFVNHFNGVFTLALPLEKLERGFTSWRFRADIEDDRKVKFSSKADVRVAANAEIQGDLAVTGIITAFLSKSIVVGEKVVFEIDDSTIVEEFGEFLDVGELEVGQKVEIAGEKFDSDTIFARRILIVGRPDDEQTLTLTTTLDAIDDSTIFATGSRFCILPFTAVQDESEETIPLSEFKPGMQVKISTVSVATGFKYVKGLRIVSREFVNQDVTVEGFINRIISLDGELPDTLEVVSTLYEIPKTRKNQIYGFDSKKIDFSELRLGEHIRMKATAREGDVLLMSEVSRINDSSAYLTVQGDLSFVSEKKIGVETVEFELTERTIVLNSEEEPEFLSHDDLMVGQIVTALYGETTKGVLETRKIFVEDADVEAVTIAGEISLIAENAFNIDDNKFQINDLTIIQNRQLLPIFFSDLEDSDLVEVTALPLGPNEFNALNVRVTGLRIDQVAVQSFVNVVEDSVIVAGGVEVQIDASTVFLDENNEETSIASITDSSIVEVTANQSEFDETKYIAEVVQIVGEVDDALFLEGRIDAVNADTVSVLGERILITPMALLRDERGDSIVYEEFNSHFSVNTAVRIQAIAIKNGPGFAWVIEKTSSSAREVRTTGAILSINETELAINKTVISFEPSVIVINADGSTAAPSNLRENEVVEVVGIGLQGFAFADTIWALDRKIIAGAYKRIDDLHFEIGPESFDWEPNVLVLDEHGLPGSVDELTDGSQVEGVVDLRSGKVIVRRLRILSAKTPTDISSRSFETSVPAKFELSQSFPNPIAQKALFEKGATIRFSLKNSATVSLDIFNILGQRVASIYSEKNLVAGIHNVVWRGRNTNGNLAAPGVYFYRLNIQGVFLAKKIVVFPVE